MDAQLAQQINPADPELEDLLQIAQECAGIESWYLNEGRYAMIIGKEIVVLEPQFVSTFLRRLIDISDRGQVGTWRVYT